MTSDNLLKPSTLKALCARTGMRPDRKSGQNFLINRGTLERIVAAVDPQPSDTVLEVGAGFGVLTCALAERMVAGVPPLRVRGGEGELRAARNPSQPPLTLRGGDIGRVIATERDRHIASTLRTIVMPYGNIEVVEGDILRMLRAAGQQGSRAAELGQPRPGSAALRLCCAAAGWKLAANLPYSITSDFLRLLFDAVGTGCLPPPERAVLLLQREVVDRLVADPSRHGEHRNVGLLTILTQLHCVSRRVARVSLSHFWPAPKVESAVVVLEKWRTPKEIEALLHGDSPPPLAPPPNGKGRNVRDGFLRLVRAAFGKRRGQLQRTLRSVTRDPGDALRMTRIDPTARPETLTLAQWIALARALPHN